LKKFRQKFYVARELRFSIALIVLWSLLAVLFFAWIARELNDYLSRSEIRIEYGFFGFLFVMVGYGIIVLVLSALFSHRFIGPFERLKVEIRRILSGDISRRLHIRKGDDVYITSFILEVNRVLENYERLVRMKAELRENLDRECLRLLSRSGPEIESPEQQREVIIALYHRLKTELGEPDAENNEGEKGKPVTPPAPASPLSDPPANPAQSAIGPPGPDRSGSIR